MNLTDFPSEVLVKLFSFLSGRDLSRVSKVCRRFNQTTEVDQIWRRRCQAEFGVRDVDPSVWTYKDAYTTLLHKYGCTLGLWQSCLSYYGGLIHVKFTGREVVGTELLPPAGTDVTRPLRSHTLFTVTPTNGGQVLCHHDNQRDRPQHHAHVAMESADGRDKLHFRCHEPEKHDHPDGQQAAFHEWLVSENLEDDIMDFSRSLHTRKHNALYKYSACRSYTPLVPPPPPTHTAALPISPGLFKGTYSAHGNEIIELSYNRDATQASALKVTGDPHIPAGRVTFVADLRRAMVLTSTQQSSVVTLREIDTADLPPHTAPASLPPQPFCVPHDCWERDELGHNTCTYRCHARGQIAGENFSSPRFSPAHWAVLDAHNFCLVWLELRSVSLYSRVTEH